MCSNFCGIFFFLEKEVFLPPKMKRELKESIPFQIYLFITCYPNAKIRHKMNTLVEKVGIS
jgi:hypothetical protein